MRAENAKFVRFMDVFIALSPVRVRIGGVTSHQIEALFEAFDAVCEKLGSKPPPPSEHPNEIMVPEDLHAPQEENAIVVAGQDNGDNKNASEPDEFEVTWPSFMEDFKLALADKDIGDILMLEFERSKKTGKRKQLRKRLVECLSGEPTQDIIPDVVLQARKMTKKSLADLFVM